MAENAGALIRRTKKLTVSGFCALAIGAGMLGGGTGIANADQIGADPVVTAGPSNVESETRGVVTAGDMGVVSASGGAESRVAEEGNCSNELSGDLSCDTAQQSLPPAGGATTQYSAQAVPGTTGGSPLPGDLSACLYSLGTAQYAGDAWNWAGHPGC